MKLPPPLLFYFHNSKMIAFRALAALLALSSSFFVRGDVTPSEPGPGSTFNAGSTCRITWQGDADSRTAWRDMAIELMSGSNLDMEHITSNFEFFFCSRMKLTFLPSAVATNQDGSRDSSFEYQCPEVTPNSAIYFYQFTSPHTITKTWTTRFTIASSSGSSTPPANPRQPGSNDPIPWGIGHLVDQSKALPPPSFTSSGNSSSTGLSSTVSSSSRGVNTQLRASTTTSTSSSSSGTSSAQSASGSTSGALGVVVDGRIWTAIMTGVMFNALF